MTYFADLTDHTYTQNKGLNVGWLGEGEDFPKGVVSQKFVDALGKLKAFNFHRGWHDCHLCGKATGNGIVQAGKFIAPVLILHYILDHNYQPPKDFILAVCSPMVTDDYPEDLVVMIHPDVQYNSKRDEIQGLIDDNLIVIGRKL